MGEVVKLQHQEIDRTVVALIHAIELEQKYSSGSPIVVVHELRKTEIQDRLNSLLGGKPTRIIIMTREEACNRDKV